jgi:transcription elongation factor GreA-like protein
MMLIDFEPGDYVVNPTHKDWGIGQVQSIIGNRVTVNFENYGKRVINVENVILEKVENEIK